VAWEARTGPRQTQTCSDTPATAQLRRGRPLTTLQPTKRQPAIGTDEGEVTEYLGCELVRDGKARTGQQFKPGMRSANYVSLTCGSAIQLLRL
jgi:hypothetical protein